MGNILLDQECSPGSGMFSWIWNVLLDQECSPGSGMFSWIRNVLLDRSVGVRAPRSLQQEVQKEVQESHDSPPPSLVESFLWSSSLFVTSSSRCQKPLLSGVGDPSINSPEM